MQVVVYAVLKMSAAHNALHFRQWELGGSFEVFFAES